MRYFNVDEYKERLAELRDLMGSEVYKTAFDFIIGELDIIPTVDGLNAYNIEIENKRKQAAKIREANHKIARQHLYEKLAEIESLKDNWNDNGAKSISKECLDNAKRIIEELPDEMVRKLEIFPTALSPSAIQFEWEDNGVYLELEVYADAVEPFAMRKNFPTNFIEALYDEMFASDEES